MTHIVVGDMCCSIGGCTRPPGHLQQLRAALTDLVKVPQQPGGGRGEGLDAAEGVPDGQCAANELVAAGRDHGVDAHIRPSQPHRALRGERARRVVLRHHQPVPE